jgi:hypothetical protein
MLCRIAENTLAQMKVIQAELGIITRSESVSSTTSVASTDSAKRLSADSTTSAPVLESEYARRQSTIKDDKPSFHETAPMDWNTQEVAAWLDAMGPPLGEYARAFNSAQITGSRLMEFKESDLKKLNVINPVHRLELFRRIRGLKAASLDGTMSRMF